MMGNHNGKDTYSPTGTGSPLDFYHTPPTSPSEEELAAMALPSAASTEWAVISVESINSLGTNSSDAATGQEKVVSSLDVQTPIPLPQRSPSEQSWQERDSGMESQAAAERTGEEMTLVLLSLMEHYRASMGLTPNTDITAGAVEMLRRLITEKEDLVEELDILKETLRTERLEWQQFQWDLQTAVSVADRLRLESDHALGLLQENHRALEEQLAQALSRQQETEQALESLRAEHKDVCCKLNEVLVQRQQEQSELDVLRNVCRLKDELTNKEANKLQKKTEAEEEVKDGGDDGSETYDPEKMEGSENTELTGKGVAEGYIRSLAALEKKKEGRGQRDPRRIVMLSERSWSLSGLPFHSDSSSQNKTSKNMSTTLPLCKKEEATKGRTGRILQRQDSWSNFYTGNQEEDQTSDSVKPQDGFSALLRRHGGSRRNSLLRWCQTRTKGYKNIEITNFSTCWEDGLAFCAIYHTFLPTHIPYDSLRPSDKEGNLDIAFKVGESVGIPATLTVEEMLKADGPDWQKVLAYVESIFRHFEM
ncbi:cytospin-A-like isoform X4 [Cyprinodon tularosa]|uniref:cytospin-A-like isoform X4 n=1 Tax=Cyprinodon tularosa TaxID=77115 RepID=UPI0018E25504|nr:cytospin-A-like isoform X4 [Cyprinodon tularosa]